MVFTTYKSSKRYGAELNEALKATSTSALPWTGSGNNNGMKAKTAPASLGGNIINLMFLWRIREI